MASIVELDIVDLRILRETVHRLLDDAARSAAIERRSELRTPFLRPVQLSHTEVDGSVRHVSCFAKDISPTGIGLVHIVPIEPGEAVVTISHDNEPDTVLMAEILYCRPCGGGWFQSGAKLRKVAARDEQRDA
jgi:hypothetical protein